MDKVTLEKANELSLELNHLKWFNSEIITRKNRHKTPLTIQSGEKLDSQLRLKDEELRNLTAMISGFLDSCIQRRDEEFKNL